MKTTIQWVVAAMLVAGLVWQAQARGAWKARAEALAAQVAITDSLLTQYRADSAVRAVALDSLRQRQDSLSADSARLATALSAARQARNTANARLRAMQARVNIDSLPPEVQDLLRVTGEAQAAAEVEARTCSANLDTAREQRTTCEAEKGLLLTQITDLETLRSRLTAERDSARALNKPPSLFSLTLEVGLGIGCTMSFTGQVQCGPSVQGTLIRFRLIQ